MYVRPRVKKEHDPPHEHIFIDPSINQTNPSRLFSFLFSFGSRHDSEGMRRRLLSRFHDIVIINIPRLRGDLGLFRGSSGTAHEHDDDDNITTTTTTTRRRRRRRTGRDAASRVSRLFCDRDGPRDGVIIRLRADPSVVPSPRVRMGSPSMATTREDGE